MSTSHEALPAELYRSPEVHERQLDAVFRLSWAGTGRAEHVAGPGAHHATDVGGAE